MTKEETDKKADIQAADRGESIGLVVPLVLSEGAKRRGEIVDRAVELARKAVGLRPSPPAVNSPLR